LVFIPNYLADFRQEHPPSDGYLRLTIMLISTRGLIL
jgi:hypothetical protein